MHLFIVGGEAIEAELRAKFGLGHSYDFCDAAAPDLLTRLGAADVGFDLREWPELHYEQPRQPLFYATATKSLSQLFHKEAPPFGAAFGICALPTLLNREHLEVSLLRPADAAPLKELCAALGTSFSLIPDRVGLLSPRMVCLFINEACYLLQTGAASINDLERTMQLRLDLEMGPFTWANKIGLGHIYQLLEALYQDTHEDRYKPCPLLKTMYLSEQQFAVAIE
ncbi:3-hydroxyacyl-CoA dehydrogenase [Hymenobacter taeanensis]|uniref:3-hydroxyacyl-CoA dehydrogenase n=1 Tax=Hymenobacter taeanensis TaxID=2735321 RepID=A0A6M6BFQ9_9BACT|nr:MULTISPECIES: 3-hydroxyacyl-CoA dehydrogenase family protein [Hymenobacter]QJX46840.1 3-hydroxyacyl-CoA dehydrogenase [Hymenobacter taeanensis]UOQ80712.1 3-hydroxyacyl-CoA dehydrogenase family protein [Hymenobacter sp. 5414T-23]